MDFQPLNGDGEGLPGAGAAQGDLLRAITGPTGFTETGVRPGFYQPSGTDAIVMRVRCPARAPAYRDP